MAIRIVILVLGVWRLSKMFSDATEGGPGGILHQMRWRAGVEHDRQGEAYGRNWFAEGLLCIKCVSVWFGLFAIGAYLWPPATVLFVPFALSGAALLIERYVSGLQ